MKVQCTKALLEYLSRKPAVYVEDTPEESTWLAHLTEMDGRTVIVMMNSATRYVTAWYKPDLEFSRVAENRFREMVFQSLREEGVNHRVLERYLDQSGPVVLTGTGSMKKVAELNNAVRRVKKLESYITPEFPIQAGISRILGMKAEKFDGGPDLPIRRMNETLKKFRGKDDEGNIYPLHDLSMFQIYIGWNYDGAEAAKRILMPSLYSFENLHGAISVLFGRDDSAHHFYAKRPGGERIPVEGEKTLTMRDAFSFGPVYFYRCHAEKGEHIICLERVVPHADWNYPQLIQSFESRNIHEPVDMRGMNAKLKYLLLGE